MSGFIEKCRMALRSFLREAIVFAAGVEIAEAHPEAAILLARNCGEILEEAISHLSSQEERDSNFERALGELEVARDLFKSVVEGGPISPAARRAIPLELEGRRILILDAAHSHTHRAIDLLASSKGFEGYHEILKLLSRARRDSAPTTLYRIACDMAGF
ncbi:MAG: hypothetical protein ACUVTL_10350 [Thermoproteota archaeon]